MKIISVIKIDNKNKIISKIKCKIVQKIVFCVRVAYTVVSDKILFRSILSCYRTKSLIKQGFF